MSATPDPVPGLRWDVDKCLADVLDDLRAFGARIEGDGNQAVQVLRGALAHSYNRGAQEAALSWSRATAVRDLSRSLEEHRAAAALNALDVAHYFAGGPDSEPMLGVMCSDTFGYAVADCEYIAMSDAPRILKLWNTEGWHGIVRWIATERKVKPIPPVEAEVNGMEAVLELVRRERARQDRKWGEQNHDPLKWLAILVEEVGEVAKAHLEHDRAGYVKESTEVAAVAVSMVECARRAEMGGNLLADRQAAMAHRDVTIVTVDARKVMPSAMLGDQEPRP